jgi:hypothetical protein
MSHLRKSIKVSGSLSAQDFNAARQIIQQAASVGRISEESAAKAERFLKLESQKKPVRLKTKILTAAFYCLSWGVALGTLAVSIYNSLFNR